MAGEVVVDALPYIDQGYDDPGIRDAALSMVEEECRRYRPTKNYLEQLPTSAVAPSSASFQTPMLRRELERLNARLPPEPLSMKRYELPPPAAGRLSDATAWVEAVDNSLAQLQHQATRVVNLELQLEYACETWKSYLEVITKMVAGAQARLSALKKETASVNWERKSIQTAMGSKLRGLEQAWVQLVSHNYRTEMAIGELEAELRDKKNAPAVQTKSSDKPAEEQESEIHSEEAKQTSEQHGGKKRDHPEDEGQEKLQPQQKKPKPPPQDMFAE